MRIRKLRIFTVFFVVFVLFAIYGLALLRTYVFKPPPSGTATPGVTVSIATLGSSPDTSSLSNGEDGFGQNQHGPELDQVRAGSNTLFTV